MASGDTKTQQYLDVAANGTRADVQHGCCETRTQSLIMDVADRIITEEETRAREDQILQNEIDEIKNNPDVADVVATYADLEAYDTSKLTDKEIIRVLADETHDGQSTYYRYDKHNDSWTYIGEAGDYYTKTQTDELLDDKQDLLTAGDGITIEEESGALVISATDTTYSAGSGLDLTGTTFSVDTTIIQPKLTAGTNVSISAQNEVSATDTTYSAGTGLSLNGTTFSADTSVLATKADLDGKQDELTAGDNISIGEESGALVISATDTTYNDFTGTDGASAGTAGLVPAPATTDAGKFLKADGTWDTAGGGSGPTVVQTTGTSTTDVMSQNAVTSMVYGRNGLGTAHRGNSVVIGDQGAESGAPGTCTHVGNNTVETAGQYTMTTAIGYNVHPYAERTTVLGANADAFGYASVAVGLGAHTVDQGQFDIGTGDYATAGYNNSNYRLLTGLYDPQSAHDAANKEYVDPTTDSSAPTTATVGRLGQIFIDTTNADAYMCVAVDSVTPTYSWKKITA